MAEIARRYEALHPGLRIDVQSGGSSRGVADARRGLADIGMVSRALGEEEGDLQPHPLARDGLALIVHASNPVAALSADDVRAIYRGARDRWSAVGGPDAEITVVHKAEGRATLEVFLAYFELADTEVHPDVVIGENEQGIKTVAGNPHAIGYVSIGAAEVAVRDGVAIRLLPVGGVAATSAELAAGRYPLARTLNLVTAGQPSARAREFIAYCRSAAVADLVGQLHFVPIATR